MAVYKGGACPVCGKHVYCVVVAMNGAKACFECYHAGKVGE